MENLSSRSTRKVTSFAIVYKRKILAIVKFCT